MKNIKIINKMLNFCSFIACTVLLYFMLQHSYYVLATTKTEQYFDERLHIRSASLLQQPYSNSYQQHYDYVQQQQQHQQKYQSQQYEPSQRLSKKQQYQNNNANSHYKKSHQNIPHINHSGRTDREEHICKTWIPAESFDKYAGAQKINEDSSKQFWHIEICCAGYSPKRWRGNTLCQPQCENCQNGLCSAPGVCQCFNEFVKSDNGDCVFTCPLGCLNGRCYLDGSCECNSGFKLDETRKFCRPICSGGCGTNSRHNCTEPAVCGCAKGYQLTDDGCQPTCQPDCGIGGECVEYNTCQCKPGYELKDGVCQSECYQNCVNGVCYQSNRCICNAGYTYHERSSQCTPI